MRARALEIVRDLGFDLAAPAIGFVLVGEPRVEIRPHRLAIELDHHLLPRPALGRPHGVAGIADRFQQDGEFVSAHPGEHGGRRRQTIVILILRPRNRVLATQTSGQTGAHLDNHLIAHGGSQGVIDVFETIEIHEENGAVGLGISLGAGEYLLQSVQEQSAIGQAGERIMK